MQPHRREDAKSSQERRLCIGESLPDQPYFRDLGAAARTAPAGG
jgi:hypothetical protein